MSTMDKKGEVQKGIAWSFVEGFGVKIVSVVIFFILAKLLGAAQFGIVAIAYAFIDFGNVLAEQGMVAALVQKEKLDREHLDTAFWINIGLGVVVFIIVFLTAPLIAGIYKEPMLTPVLRTTASLFLIGPSGLVHVAQLTRTMNFKAIARARIIGLVAGAVVSLTMAFAGYGVWALVFQKLVFIILSTLLFWFYNKWVPRLSFSWVHFRELFSFSYKMLLNHFLMYFNRSSAELVIGFFYGAAATGLYSFSYKIFQSTIETANTSVNKVMLPLFASVQNDKEQLMKYFYKAVGYSFMVMLPFLALLIFLSPDAIPYFFNATWAQSSGLLQLVAIAGTIYMIFFYSNSVFISIGKPGFVITFTLINIAISLTLLAFASRFPLIYVGYASILTSVLLLPIAYFLLKKVVPVHGATLMQHLSKPVLVGGISFFVLFVTSSMIPLFSPEWIWFIVQGVLWAIAVAATIYFIFPSALAPVMNKFNRFRPAKHTSPKEDPEPEPNEELLESVSPHPK